GAVTVLGLHPREGAAAERLLVRAIKGRRTAPRLLPGLILHEPDGAYTEAAQAILAGKRAIDLDGGP
ncbi:MAG: methyltransferase, partial [Devosiaceae bacterium]|nr:methyltransferase [Devosiaceae bacterium MH13]